MDDEHHVTIDEGKDFCSNPEKTSQILNHFSERIIANPRGPSQGDKSKTSFKAATRMYAVLPNYNKVKSLSKNYIK